MLYVIIDIPMHMKVEIDAYFDLFAYMYAESIFRLCDAHWDSVTDIHS